MSAELLDALEAHAAKAVTACYGPDIPEAARFWIQKGIEGMRLSVAEALIDGDLAENSSAFERGAYPLEVGKLPCCMASRHGASYLGGGHSEVG